MNPDKIFKDLKIGLKAFGGDATNEIFNGRNFYGYGMLENAFLVYDD